MRVAELAPDAPPSDRAFLGHPKGLGYLAFTEAWERFSYYGMQSLLVLYMAKQLLLPGHVENIAFFDNFRKLFGGLAGALLMALGHFLMAFEVSFLFALLAGGAGVVFLALKFGLASRLRVAAPAAAA